MAKSRRDFHKKTIAQAHGNAVRAIGYLESLEEKFAVDHPPHAQYLGLICMLLAQVTQMIDTFCDKAWGLHPDDYSSWRNQGRHRKKIDSDAN